ncbi:type VI secretion system tip protein VgrG [Marinigracilibium pacificum]|uniref:Type VI secretion system tip protein VgrG n=1 Tax=Marinigracilibium pacificum TaxID=2729599 RepID=A0A848J5R9_9BACT|nr:type VI secretion system tip protein VgrG [Marinigracilibium pacificum]NMM48472.1 type VI secretion system tip protein VgrG [Marinigracilibium pacificum]
MNNLIEKSGLVTTTIMINGEEVPGHYGVIYIRVDKAINKVSSATVEFTDGGTAESQDFELSNDDLFNAGNEIEIKAGYQNEQETIFKGVIVRQNLRIMRSGSSRFIIDCKHKAVKLTLARKNNIYYDSTDSDMINKIFGEYEIEYEVEDTETEHPELVQHHASDWDFILMRSDINGLLVNTGDEKLTIKKIDLAEEAVLEVGHGSGLLSFNGDADARDQFIAVNAYAWDSANLELVDASGEPVGEIEAGEKTSEELAGVFGIEDVPLQSPGFMQQSMLKAWADAKITRSRLAKVKGNLTVLGNYYVNPGNFIKLSGLSKQFNGKNYISGVSHIIEEGNWTTDYQLGLSYDWYSEERPYVNSQLASGLAPAIQGLHTGLVKQIHEDPDGNYRVQVTVPTLQNDNMPLWARLANQYATADAGLFFFPEIGDEVLIGFLNDDPQNPIILGSLYGKQKKPKYTPEEENPIKSIFTKGELEIQFNDGDKILTISTPGGNKFILDDDQKTVTLINEENGNTMLMSADGISFESDGDITLKAKGNVLVESKQNTEVKATGDFVAEGINVNLTGSAKFAAEGAQAEVSGSAMTVIKGGIVQIN